MMKVIIEGASGYSGMELTKLLAWHPRVSVAAVSSSRWAEQTVASRLGLSGAVGELRYQKEPEQEADLVFLATPAEASLSLAPKWLGRGSRVIDLSNAYRGDDSAVYGLTEHFRDQIEGAQLIANPGCYPTASLTALLPLLKAGMVGEGAVIIDAKSGATGAGRKLADHLLYNELGANHYPYRVGDHQHVPEIERVLGRGIVFTPHLLPTRRGLLVSAYVPVQPQVGPDDIGACLTDAYETEPFVQVVSPGQAIGIAEVAHTPICRVASAAVVKDGIARVFGSIDNLLKGAASQAVQNMNRVFGWDEKEGLLP